MIRRLLTVVSTVILLLMCSGCCGIGEAPPSQLRRYEKDLNGLTRPQVIAYLDKDRFDVIWFAGPHVLQARKYTSFCFWQLRRYFIGVQATFSTDNERVDQVDAFVSARGP